MRMRFEIMRARKISHVIRKISHFRRIPKDAASLNNTSNVSGDAFQYTRHDKNDYLNHNNQRYPLCNRRVCLITCLACFCVLRAPRDYVLYVSTYFLFSRALHACVPSSFCFVRAFIFFTCLTCLHFFTCSWFFIALLALSFLRAYILLMHCQAPINELICDLSSLLLLNSVIYQRLLSIFTSIKLHDFFLHDFLFSCNKKY